MLFAWTDLETTGSQDDDPIIEVGIVLSTEHLEIVDAHNWLVAPPDLLDAINRIRKNKVVRDMHEKNGLLIEMCFNTSSLTAEKVENQIINWLNPYRAEFAADRANKPVVLAGSGVGHFDKKHLQREMPYLSQIFTHFVIDVGVIRRTVEMYSPAIAAKAKEQYKALRENGKTHRALEDAALHLEEYRFYKENVFDKLEARATRSKK